MRILIALTLALAFAAIAAHAEPPPITQNQIVRDLVEHIRKTGKGDTNGYPPHWEGGSEGAWASQRIYAIGKPAVPVLIEAVDDESPWVQMWAMETLGRLKERRAIPAIVNQLETSNDNAVIAAAANALRMMKAREALPGLLRAAKLPPDFLNRPRGAAAQALGELRDPSALPILESILGSQLPSSGDGGPGPDVRPAFAVAKFGRQGIAILQKAIKGEGRFAPEAAIHALAHIRRVDDLLPLVQAADSEWDRSIAVRELVRLGDKRAIPYFVALLREEDYWMVENAACGLGRFKAKEAAPALRAALERASRLKDDGAPVTTDSVVECLLWALTRIGDRESIPFIEKKMLSPAEASRFDLYSRAYSELKGRAALPVLIRLLANATATTSSGYGPEADLFYARRQVARAILVQHVDGVRATIEALESGAINEGQMAAVISSIDAFPTVSESLWPDATLSQTREMLRATLELLRRPAGEARSAAASLLYVLPMPQARGTMIAMLADPDPRIRDSAISGLQAIHDPRAIQPLIDGILTEDKEHAARASIRAEELAGFGKPAADPILRALPKADDRARKAFLLALAAIKTHGTVPALIQALKDPDRDIARAAAKGLCLIGTPEAREALRKQGQNPDIRIRWQVFLALCEPDRRPKDPPEYVPDSWKPGTWPRVGPAVGG